jgi:sigma-B regulation protein RsbU (phosphoserine phosphatase)
VKPLFVSGSVSGEQRQWPLNRPRISVGRSSGNAIQLDDRTVSRRHAEIVSEGEQWMLRDLGGRNVTRVNGTPTSGTVPLELGDRIAFGRVVLRVTDGDSSDTATLTDSKTLATALQIPAAEVLRRGLHDGGATETRAVVRALAAAGRLLVRHDPLHETCEELLRVVESVVPASRLILLVRDEMHSGAQQVAARSCGRVVSEPMLMSEGIFNSVLETGSAVITTDAMSDPRFDLSDSVRLLKTHSAMAAPLYEGGSIRGLLYADHAHPDVRYGRPDLEILTLFGNMIAAKIANDRLEEARFNLIELEHEMEMAGRIQRTLLVEDPPVIPGYECHAALESCEAVGGDLYDFHPMPDGSVYFVLGDAAGKGIAASLLMARFLALADALYEHCEDPADLATRLNDLLARRSRAGRFVTAFIGRLEPMTGRLRYVNAGHPSALLLGGGAVQELESVGPPCGAYAPFVYQTCVAHVPPGGLLSAFTDGFTDAMRGPGEFFGADRVTKLLVENAAVRPLEAVSDRALAELDSYLRGGPRQDDVTMLLMRSAVGS